MNDHVTEANFQQEVLQADGPVLVDFWTDWCTSCHAVASVVERVVAEHELKRVKVNYEDDEQRLAERYGMQSIPNIILFEHGAPRAPTIGAQPKSALERALGLAE